MRLFKSGLASLSLFATMLFVSASCFAIPTTYIDSSIASSVSVLETDAGILVGYLTALGMIIVAAFYVWGVLKKIIGKSK
jgi:hypothetical protein